MNNDVEGWHHRLNAKARKNSLQFYVLVKLLFREASYVTWQVKFISDGKVLRRQRILVHSCTSKIDKLWNVYECKELTSSYKSLRASSKLYIAEMLTFMFVYIYTVLNLLIRTSTCYLHSLLQH